MKRRTLFKGRCLSVFFKTPRILQLLIVFAISTGITFAQSSKTITGTVLDKTGETLPGVSVLVNGTSTGTITDFNGEFSIEMPASNNTLKFSFIGMKSQLVDVTTLRKVTVTLESDMIGLEEVVAIGYGVVRKTDVTSAVSSIKEEDFNQIPVTSSPMEMVQGKIGGLAIVRPEGGDPNGEIQLQIRGLSTVSGGKEPLIVVDGVPGGDLNSINPQDIKSFDVLRDGSAAAIYGSRGTSGVIIVTTKDGKGSKKPQIEYSTNYSLNTPYNIIQPMNRDEYLDYQQQLYDHGDADWKAIADGMADYGYDTNWWDVMLENTVTKEHQLSFNQAGEDGSFVASVRYQENPGVLKRTFKNTLNGRIGARLNKWDNKLKLQMNLYGTVADGNGSEPNTNKPGQSLFRQAYQWNPTSPVYIDGDESLGYNYVGHDMKSWANPANLINEYEYNYRTYNLLANAKAILEPIKNLRFSVLGASDIRTRLDGESQSFESHDAIEQSINGYAKRESSLKQTNTVESTVSYNYVVNESSVEVLAGHSYQRTLQEGFWAENSNFDFDQSYNNLGSGSYLKEGIADIESTKYTSTLVAFFGRAIFNYKDRYLVNGTIRREGSSLVGANNQWKNFPSASVAWKVSNESFAEAIPSVITNIKLRAGYGITGNAFTQFNNNKMLFGTGTAGGSYPTLANDPTQVAQGWGAVRAANPDLDWETKTEYNIGLDFNLLNDRITVSTDYYNRTVDNLYYLFELPAGVLPGDEQWRNAGSIQNSGYEFNINAVAMKERNFTWTVNFNGSFNENELLEFRRNPEDEPSPIYLEGVPVPLHPNKTYVLEEGHSLGDMWGHKYAGTDENGAVLVYVRNEEGVFDGSTALYGGIKNSDDDKQVIGNGMPSTYLNLTNTFQYKDFDLSFMFRGAFGFDVLNQPRMYFGNPQFGEALNNVFPEAAEAPFWDQVHLTDYYVEKGDYVKLDNVTLGYTKTFNTTKYIERVRLYVSGKNLFVITGYKGSDPELGISTLTPGNDAIGDIYPRISTFTMGLNIVF